MVGKKKILSVCNPIVANFTTVQNEDFPTCRDFLNVRPKAYVPYWNIRLVSGILRNKEY